MPFPVMIQLFVKETQKVLKKDDFVQNVNKAIGENSENLPEKIRQALEIEHVNPDDQIIKKAREVIVFLYAKQTKIENPNFSDFVSKFNNKNYFSSYFRNPNHIHGITKSPIFHYSNFQI